jgi:uncharacterized SAM-binding protein YcdF (DUF218 family)
VGARNTYIVRKAAAALETQKLPEAQIAIMGGQQHRVNQVCFLFAEIEKHRVQVMARVVDAIGNDDTGRPIEILFGALAMQEWGIRLDLREEKVDWSRYSTSFVEY